MRVGSLLMMFVVILIGFGFLLSSNLSLHQNLQEAQASALLKRNALLAEQAHDHQQELEMLRAQNLALQKEIERLHAPPDEDSAKASWSDVWRAVASSAGYLLLFVPLIVLAISYLTFVATQRANHVHRNRADKTLSIQLTREEMNMIARRRRGKRSK